MLNISIIHKFVNETHFKNGHQIVISCVCQMHLFLYPAPETRINQRFTEFIYFMRILRS